MCLMKQFGSWAVVILMACGGAVMAADASLQYVGSEPRHGLSRAVVVGDVPLLHTAQILPRSSDGNIATGDAAAQMQVALEILEALLKQSGSGLDQLVRLNVYAVDMDAAQAA